VVKRAALVVVAAVGLVAGCGDWGPLAPYEWQGVGQTSSETYAVRLVYSLYGDSVIGSYHLRGSSSPTGKAEGHINGDVIVLELSPSTTCMYSFVGTVSETRLTGTFVSETCATARSGTWDLLRKN
jgi:hypothetical protein